MKVGDLVRIRRLLQHPWQVEGVVKKVGLVTAVNYQRDMTAVLIGGRTEYIKSKYLEVANG